MCYPVVIVWFILTHIRTRDDHNNHKRACSWLLRRMGMVLHYAECCYRILVQDIYPHFVFSVSARTKCVPPYQVVCSASSVRLGYAKLRSWQNADFRTQKMPRGNKFHSGQNSSLENRSKPLYYGMQTTYSNYRSKPQKSKGKSPFSRTEATATSWLQEHIYFGVGPRIWVGDFPFMMFCLMAAKSYRKRPVPDAGDTAKEERYKWRPLLEHLRGGFRGVVAGRSTMSRSSPLSLTGTPGIFRPPNISSR